ncbi:MAG: sugar phosphate nucleotidyltransferase [Candidatus Dojkabacteria bacterium]
MPHVVVLAAGSSSRFEPLKEKNLYKFLGKTVLQHIIEQFLANGFEKFTVIAGSHNIGLVEKDLKENVSAKHIRILEQKGDGQAGAVSTGIESLVDEQDVLIINGNDVYETNLIESFANKVSQYKAGGHNILTGYKVDSYFPGGYLLVEGEEVKGVIEKPGEGNEPSDLVRIVFDYFSSVKDLKQSLAKASSNKDDLYETALNDMINTDKKFKLLRYSGEWNSIKYPWHVLSLMQYFLGTLEAQIVADDAFISDKATVRGKVVIESGAKVFDGACINGPAYIGKNVIVGNGALVRDSIVGDKSVVGYNSEVARSYLREEVWLHTNYVGDSIIDKNVSFGSGAVTANLRLDEENISIEVKGEKIDTGVQKIGAIIGPYVRIGVGAKLMPGVKIGGNSAIGPGVVLSQDLGVNSFIQVKQQLEIKENKLDISGIDREQLKNKLEK